MASNLLPLESPEVPVAKSPKKRCDEANNDSEKAPTASKKILPNFIARRTRQARKVEEDRNNQLPREASPEIVEIEEFVKPPEMEIKKKAPVRRKQLKLTDAFSTPSPGSRRKVGAATKTILTESVTKTKDDNSAGPSKSPGLNASHHMTTPEAAQTKKPTTLFPIRKRSVRMDEKLKKEKENADLYKRILDGEEDTRIEIKVFEGKGRGLVTKDAFEKGEFVVEYSGDLITDRDVAREKEEFYALHPETYGCYMYYFKHAGKTLCVDATAETKRFGRLLNHSKTKPNLRTEVVEIEKKPYLILRAIDYIAAGEELVYDYGDRSPASLAAFPWLKV